jgi:hypothetical protein
VIHHPAAVIGGVAFEAFTGAGLRVRSASPPNTESEPPVTLSPLRESACQSGGGNDVRRRREEGSGKAVRPVPILRPVISLVFAASKKVPPSLADGEEC